MHPNVCTSHFMYYKYIYMHIYIYMQSNNNWHPAHTCSVKMIIQIFECFLKLDFSQLVYICRFYDVYSNVDSSITWTRFAKMSCLLHFLILTLPRKVFYFDSSMQAICCDITDYLTSDMRAKPYQECNKQHVWPHYYL